MIRLKKITSPFDLSPEQLTVSILKQKKLSEPDLLEITLHDVQLMYAVNIKL